MARLDCESGAAKHGLDNLRTALAARREATPFVETLAAEVEASCLLALGKLEDARVAAQRGLEAAKSTRRFQYQASNAFLLAGIQALAGEAQAAAQSVAPLVDEANAKGHGPSQLEGRLALAMFRLQAGEAARQDLIRLTSEARHLGFLRIARLSNHAVSDTHASHRKALLDDRERTPRGDEPG